MNLRVKWRGLCWWRERTFEHILRAEYEDRIISVWSGCTFNLLCRAQSLFSFSSKNSIMWRSLILLSIFWYVGDLNSYVPSILFWYLLMSLITNCNTLFSQRHLLLLLFLISKKQNPLADSQSCTHVRKHCSYVPELRTSAADAVSPSLHPSASIPTSWFHTADFVLKGRLHIDPGKTGGSPVSYSHSHS